MPSSLAPRARILSSVGSWSAISRQDRRIEESKFCWILQQLDHAFEQTTGTAAVDAAMVEAQCNLRFGFGNEFLFRFVPRRNFFADTEAEQQRLIGQGNRRSPFHSE